MLTDKSKHFRDESSNQAEDIIIEAREAIKKFLTNYQRIILLQMLEMLKKMMVIM